MKKSLSYSQFLQIKIICNTEEEFESQIVYDCILSKGYNSHNLCLDRVRDTRQETLFEEKEFTLQIVWFLLRLFHLYRVR